MGNTESTNTNINPVIMPEHQENTILSDEAEDTTFNRSNDEGTPTIDVQQTFLMALPDIPPELPEGTTTTEVQDAFLMSLPASALYLPDFPEDLNMPFSIVVINQPTNPPESQQEIEP
eukprot:103194-Ditylum_brightwellii.AAC.1